MSELTSFKIYCTLQVAGFPRFLERKRWLDNDIRHSAAATPDGSATAFRADEQTSCVLVAEALVVALGECHHLGCGRFWTPNPAERFLWAIGQMWWPYKSFRKSWFESRWTQQDAADFLAPRIKEKLLPLGKTAAMTEKAVGFKLAFSNSIHVPQFLTAVRLKSFEKVLQSCKCG